MITIHGIEGHIILLCKNHYTCKSLDIALRMLWAIRCGYDYDNITDKSANRYIANELHKILMKVNPKRLENFHETIHEEISNMFRYPDYTPLEIMIRLYCNELSYLHVREKVGKLWEWRIKLPKPKKQVLNCIFRGNGRYEDYKLLN